MLWDFLQPVSPGQSRPAGETREPTRTGHGSLQRSGGNLRLASTVAAGSPFVKLASMRHANESGDAGHVQPAGRAQPRDHLLGYTLDSDRRRVRIRSAPY